MLVHPEVAAMQAMCVGHSVHQGGHNVPALVQCALFDHQLYCLHIVVVHDQGEQ